PPAPQFPGQPSRNQSHNNPCQEPMGSLVPHAPEVPFHFLLLHHQRRHHRQHFHCSSSFIPQPVPAASCNESSPTPAPNPGSVFPPPRAPETLSSTSSATRSFASLNVGVSTSL